ncbi:MAG: spore cortex biosynthesis protein YabQ [Clostridia bacterium]|nr:spore cortex biosynthesis protein YabQ [Clostridia bacterium]
MTWTVVRAVSDIATEHAVLVEASAAGDVRAVPAALVCGVCLGILYDLIRLGLCVLRVLPAAELPAGIGFPHGAIRKLSAVRLRILPPADAADGARRIGARAAHIVEFFADVLYFLICGCIGAIFLYRFCNGAVRWYAVVCALIGAALYRRLLRGCVLCVTALPILLLRAGAVTICNTVLCPPLRLLMRAVRGIGRILRKGKRRAAAACTERKIGEKSIWQKKRNSRKRRSVFLRRSRSSSFSASAQSRSSV